MYAELNWMTTFAKSLCQPVVVHNSVAHFASYRLLRELSLAPTKNRIRKGTIQIGFTNPNSWV